MLSDSAKHWSTRSTRDQCTDYDAGAGSGSGSERCLQFPTADELRTADSNL